MGPRSRVTLVVVAIGIVTGGLRLWGGIGEGSLLFAGTGEELGSLRAVFNDSGSFATLQQLGNRFAVHLVASKSETDPPGVRTHRFFLGSRKARSTRTYELSIVATDQGGGVFAFETNGLFVRRTAPPENDPAVIDTDRLHVLRALLNDDGDADREGVYEELQECLLQHDIVRVAIERQIDDESKDGERIYDAHFTIRERSDQSESELCFRTLYHIPSKVVLAFSSLCN